MAPDYQKIIDFMKASGKRLHEKHGKIPDIGVTKQYLTEEDIVIERGFESIIKDFGDDHVLYAEEENAAFTNSKNIWVVDPISGTKCFIKGEPHYSIVVAHLSDNKVVFAAVYDPSVDEFFTAYKSKGAFLNDKQINVSNTNRNIILRPSSQWKDPEAVKKIEESLKTQNYNIEINTFSMAVNYCWIAMGRFDGVISLTKDSFPEFAGGFIIQEAGGQFTNNKGEPNIVSSDRVFIGGNTTTYSSLFSVVKNIIPS